MKIFSINVCNMMVDLSLQHDCQTLPPQHNTGTDKAVQVKDTAWTFEGEDMLNKVVSFLCIAFLEILISHLFIGVFLLLFFSIIYLVYFLLLFVFNLFNYSSFVAICITFKHWMCVCELLCLDVCNN